MNELDVLYEALYALECGKLNEAWAADSYWPGE